MNTITASFWVFIGIVLTFLSCTSPIPSSENASSGSRNLNTYDFELPPHFPEPEVPADNPMSEEKVVLGRRLFYDPRLSINEKSSCATCHQQARAFTDGMPRAIGTTGEVHPRGSMGLTNVVYSARLAWANPLVKELEHQALLPMFGEAPVELGLSGQEHVLLERIEQDPDYPALFAEAWPDGAISLERIVQAIASFERTLLSFNSPYDRYVQGDKDALSPAAVRGLELFMSERLECFHCHGGFNFSDNLTHTRLPTGAANFHNTGLYNLGNGAYPADNPGVFEVTGDPTDMGRFKAPTLRNIAVTAPFMHDGSLATLSDVLDHYAAGGRQLTEGPNAGDGSTSPFKSEFVAGFLLEPQEKADLIAFLESLTDPTFLTDERLSDPF